MAREWEGVLATWSQPPSESESQKADNAVRIIKKAIDASADLANRSISVIAQGSYRNRTNVRQDSDVDICVLCSPPIMVSYDLAPGLTDAAAGLSDAGYDYSKYRNEVGKALVDYLGASGVTRGKKAFDVHENTYRLDADVVACFGCRQYQRNNDNRVIFETGTAFIPDGGWRIHNWPEQNYANGVAKNDATGRFYKPLVRILKRLKNEMIESGCVSCASVPSFLLECLLYNLTPDAFQEPTWFATLQRVLRDLHSMLGTADQSREMEEVNGLKYLLRGGQPWTRDQASAFVAEAWTYIHSF